MGSILKIGVLQVEATEPEVNIHEVIEEEYVQPLPAADTFPQQGMRSSPANIMKTSKWE